MNGSPIGSYAFRPSPVTINYSMAYEEEQARIFAGMSIAEYEALPGTPMWVNPTTGGRSKCHIIMSYRMSNTIPNVANDASAREMERNAKRRRLN